MAGILAMAVVTGVGVGAYLGGPFALAGDRKPAAAGPRPSTSGSPSASTTPAPSQGPSGGQGQPDPTPSTPPSSSPSPAKPPVVKRPSGQCAQTGPTQLAVERYLAKHTEFGKVTVDGKQDAVDCATIKKFQARYGIQGAGLAGPVSGKVVGRLGSAALGKCDAGSGTTVCLDLTSQTMWVERGGAVVLGPVPIRTGRAGLDTPAGHFRIGNKKKSTISTIYKVPLPYWQQFNADMGFHQTPSYLYDGGSPGSHGCVNVLRRDAIALYKLTKVGTPVHIFGRKPGT
jgi:lipoprotein-anchoring transpeptidase ErfK/SrfK